MEHALLARAVLIYYDWRGQNLDLAYFVIDDGLLRIKALIDIRQLHRLHLDRGEDSR